ncbi:MAG: hypothetical protein FGM15_02735 [Chthoniobacterales bacterium]|nr:hypothetical protein [Chthoniobacterales bacterium]
MRLPLTVACAAGFLLAHEVIASDPASSGEMLVVPPAEPRPESRGHSRVPADLPATGPEASPPPAASGTQGEEEANSQDADLPAPAFALSRYTPVWERSPFQVESVAPPPESAALSQSYALTGIAQINGDPIIFVLERATNLRHMIDKKKGANDLSLVQVDIQKEYAKSTATIRKGSEVGVIQFDALAAGAAMPPAGMMQAPVPVNLRPGVPVPVPAIPVAPQAQARPAPGVVPAVPGPAVPGNQQVQPAPGSGQQEAPPPRVIRRRAIVPAAP